MKAAVFRGVGQALNIDEVDRPRPGPGEMLIRVHACGICGTDLHLTEDEGALRAGVVLGHEFCGEVVEIGAGVDDSWRLGDRAVSMPFIGCGACATCLAGEPIWCRRMRGHFNGQVSGGFGEFTTIGALGSVKVPSAVTWDEAALIEPLAVGLHGVKRARLPAGADVLIVGAGPVGLGAVIWARALGARRIAVTARSNRAAAMALELGADEFIPSDVDVRKGFRAMAGRPPDAVFECVGAPGVLDYCMNLAPPRGLVLALAGCTRPDPILGATGLNKELTISWALGYDIGDFRLAVDAAERKLFDPTVMITDRVGYDDFPGAFEALRQRTHQCKVLLTPGA